MAWSRPLVILLCLCGAGCGGLTVPAPKPVAVSGTVVSDGKPLADGNIYFKTVQTGAVETFPIKNGKFEGRALAGERRVEINAYKVTKQNLSGVEADVQESLVPDKYNVNSKLTATVTESGPNVFKFELESK